ncbi:hypothetical protein CKM354_001126700 [Cercospora kikuchii]|uniref:SCP domain-containing protein n=1 Tax=Cercospora kikuchii TaxID=84275 RepID=A0A9P3FK76_9PEZI|nr:uncharacterized protein CKM354_001126700 [Cercospora kikuchii]GIZ48197.1 hypothetical protein CKM354_001126700 [Cercospora kikuchii]
MLATSVTTMLCYTTATIVLSTIRCSSASGEGSATASPSTSRALALATWTPRPGFHNGSLESEILNSTNYYRSRHAARPVAWNSTLAHFAQGWAAGCIWGHSGGPYGENIAAGFVNATLAVDAWAGEEVEYDYEKEGFSLATGHFTQLVWRDTTEVGCAIAQCQSLVGTKVHGAYLVCEYNPAGNVGRAFEANVKAAAD